MQQIFFFIKKLRKVAFLLFLLPTFALIGSLIFNNILVRYNFTYHSYESGKNYPSSHICTVENDYCFKINMIKSKKLDDCPSFNRHDRDVTIDGKQIDWDGTSNSKQKSVEIVNATLSKNLYGGIFSINISNLLNERYEKPATYSQNGRQLRFGFRNKF